MGRLLGTAILITPYRRIVLSIEPIMFLPEIVQGLVNMRSHLEEENLNFEDFQYCALEELWAKPPGEWLRTCGFVEFSPNEDSLLRYLVPPIEDRELEMHREAVRAYSVSNANISVGAIAGEFYTAKFHWFENELIADLQNEPREYSFIVLPIEIVSFQFMVVADFEPSL